MNQLDMASWANAGVILGVISTGMAIATPPALYAVTKIRKVVGLLDEVRAQLYPNGGSSLRDAIARIEMSLADQHEVQRMLLNLDEERAYFEMDRHGELTWASTGFLLMTERQLDDVTGMGWVANIHLDDRQDVIDERDQAVTRHRRFEVNFRWVTRTGSVRPVRCVVAPTKGGYFGRIVPHHQIAA